MRTLLFSLLLGLLASGGVAQPRPFTWTDLMDYRSAEHVAWSDAGETLALTARPDRGDPEGMVHTTDGQTVRRVARGSHPAVAATGQFVAFRLNPPLSALERAERDRKPAPPNGMVLVDVASGAQTTVERVRAFAFSADGRFLAIHHHAADTTGLPAEIKSRKRTHGHALTLRHLATGEEQTYRHVRDFSWSATGATLALSTTLPDALTLITPETGASREVVRVDVSRFASLSWSRTAHLAFVRIAEDSTGKALSERSLHVWTGRELRSWTSGLPTGHELLPDSRLAWSRDGQRLFVGHRPTRPDVAPDTAFIFRDVDSLLARADVDVWHHLDRRIIPHQEQTWQAEQNRQHLSVLHLAQNRIVTLDRDTLRTDLSVHGNAVLGRVSHSYDRAGSWDAFRFDVHHIPLDGRAPTRVVAGVTGGFSMSPSGRFVAYFENGNWHVLDTAGGQRRALTAGWDVSLVREDHDSPNEAPAYGLGGWLENDAALLIYDRFDVWRVPVDGRPATRLTDGRAQRITYRVERTQQDEEPYHPAAGPLLLSTFHETDKTSGFARVQSDRAGVEVLVHGPHRFTFVRPAKTAERWLFTREAYTESPDYWVTSPAFDAPRRVTDLNPQLREMAWGRPELMSWRTQDGDLTEGILIYPPNYDPSRTYPVYVYFYDILADRLHHFWTPVLNHRPALALYSSDDYLVFLPDVRYTIGQPGMSAMRHIVPGVQQLIERGLADPERIGLHGHSWGGYQALYMATQTHLFRAISAGAPVSNMTSAYGGIRWASGFSRQFQYEQAQSRLGRSLWEGRDLYIDNSPLFFADRIRTPLLMFFGDEDGAVPWEQGIEMYLAMRRLDKDVIMLHYRGEGHHPARYPSKADWGIRMKQFFDVHLKDAPAPSWMTEGRPYRRR